MSFATAQQTFARQSARERQSLSQALVQPYTGAPSYATADGKPVTVFLSAVRAERELSESGNGFITLHKAQLRVAKTCPWQPSEGVEFVNIATSERFRCNAAIGGGSDFGAEIVCDVVRIGE